MRATSKGVRSGDVHARLPASVVLQRIRDDAPANFFTLGWLVAGLHKRAFGVIILLFAVVAVTPGIANVVGLLLLVPAFQMATGQRAPAFPRRVATHPFATRRLATLMQRALPLLRAIEKMIHPRLATPAEPTKRLVGAIVLLSSATMVFSPIPFSNVVPALVIALIALAYLEEDGALLAIGLLAAVVMDALALTAAWETLRGAEWLSRVW